MDGWMDGWMDAGFLGREEKEFNALRSRGLAW